ncbi:glycosyltransferase family 2 protein [Pseudoruegeria sp. SK021]|uniref:glycosyltransferase family 2 protein n=1 Tax=Pseudoruegeria sp. SK021 TaxID=1933035 RepID=UPI000A22F1A4|nr:glycosyltransferase family 2 protein [Pseudoruegeria sp. SK021]OSP54377.1 hypothetical protein BV911_12920 [Pseudoruegeria sp. SK021]
MLGLMATFGCLGVAVVWPMTGVLICAAVFILQVLLMGLRPVAARVPPPIRRMPETMGAPVFSVHVATHSEPPLLVIRTLRALLKQDWPAQQYEVIVMDNNTRDPALWKPVEAFCQGYNARLKFLHQMDVQGAKAGALTIALSHSRPDATHIVTVDADYIVAPTFLSAAAEALARTGADYVQFPQSYAGAQGVAAGVDAELEEYFRSNARVADGAEAVLLTGTLCVISKQALLAAGGWSGATTTEDAEMGVRLCNAGFSGRYIDQVVGQGLLPLSFRDLETQRYRWCSGNFQTLRLHLSTILSRNSTLSISKRLVLASQLTAWFNLALVPTVLMLTALLTGAGPSSIVVLAAGVVFLSFLDIVFCVFGRGLRDGQSGSVMCQALACRLALAPKSARATFDAMLGGGLSFVVTNKSGAGGHGEGWVPIEHLTLFGTALVLLIAQPSGNLLVDAALVILMLPLPAALFTETRLRAYRDAVLPLQLKAVP